MGKRKSSRFKLIAASVAIVFFAQSCAVIGPKYQTIPVTSNPPQARITVDNKFVGQTPLNLKLSRKDDHVIQIEMEGYEPAKIFVSPQPGSEGSAGSGMAAGLPMTLVGMTLGLVVGLFVAPQDKVAHEEESPWVLGGIALGAVPGIYVMFSSYQTQLQPQRVYVLLKKAAEGDQSSASGSGVVQRIEISTEELSSVNWISIAVEKK
jgi:hypothetical protein